VHMGAILPNALKTCKSRADFGNRPLVRLGSACQGPIFTRMSWGERGRSPASVLRSRLKTGIVSRPSIGMILNHRCPFARHWAQRLTPLGSGTIIAPIPFAHRGRSIALSDTPARSATPLLSGQPVAIALQKAKS
jgi:hypothetical protein